MERAWQFLVDSICLDTSGTGMVINAMHDVDFKLVLKFIITLH
jgi:hypothetical protein